jgi:hypothetical protein
MRITCQSSFDDVHDRVPFSFRIVLSAAASLNSQSPSQKELGNLIANEEE